MRMVIIKELLPNPIGKDAAGEWITLLNDGDAEANLRGWSVKDASNKKFVFGSETLLAGQELKLPYSLTRITLNNDGDTVSLWDERGSKVDELSYGQVSEEEVVVSAKIASVAEPQQLAASALAAQEFAGSKITGEAINPLLIALGVALTFGIVAAILTKKLLET